MMLSPQAARMGTVFTTLRSIGKRGMARTKNRAWIGSYASNNMTFGTTTRHNNTLAYYDDDTNYSAVKPPAWMMNVGRECDKWLHGARSDDWFTGVHPTKCPGVDRKGILRSCALPNLSAVTRKAAKDYFDNSWTLYETLFAGLKGDDPFYRPPVHGLRHPQIFYYGHTACLYVNKLRLSGVLDKPVNAHFESIFEVGVDEMLWDDMNKNDMIWPTVKEVHDYRKQVYKVVTDAILHHPSFNDDTTTLVNQQHPMWALFLGFEHERIHLETSSVLFREMPLELVQRPRNWPPLHPSAYHHDGNNKNNNMQHHRQHFPPITTKNPVPGVHYPVNPMIAVDDTQSVDLGKPADFPSFGWDNEYGERNVNVPPFQASAYMVTNGEFYQFVQMGGYRTREYWCEDGWAWRVHRNMKGPFFWQLAGPAGTHEYKLRTIFEVISMPWNWPVDVNYYEAKAFCRWKTATEGSPTLEPYRVLTEAEHHVIRRKEHNLEAARKDVMTDKVMSTSGIHFSDGPTGSNLNLSYSSQNPVTFFAPSQTGHYDTTGSAWEWTEDHFNPLKGFEVHHIYDDFSTPCFDGKHSMIVGGSFISTGDEASVFARFHFRPHFLQHSGFRLVASNHDAPATHLFAGNNFKGQAAAAARDVLPTNSNSDEPVITASSDTDNVYESEASLHMYLGLHYPSSGEKENVPSILPHAHAPTHGTRFPQRVAQLLVALEPVRTNHTVLDVGCAVGGSSFELAKTFHHVDAFDYSDSFVRAAQQMQANDFIQFRIPMEADLYAEVQAVHEAGVDASVRSKIDFFTGDACQIQEMARTKRLGTYDGVVMSNLLCRLPNPKACLDGLPLVVNKGGVVVLVTPFSWLDEFTERGNWLGGFTDSVTNKAVHSKDVLRDIMETNGFKKIHEEQFPLIIREHQRKYQYIISEATGWRKTD